MKLVKDLLMVAALNVLISSVAGTLMYGVWCIVRRKWDSVSGVYMMLHLVVWIMVCPVFLAVVVLTGRDSAGGYGYLYMVTPPIRVLLECAVAIWAIGAARNLLRYLREWISHIKKSRDWMKAGCHSHELADAAARRLGIRRSVVVQEGYTVLVPELAGWLQPKIRVPIQTYEDEVWDHIFTHELIHYRSGDRLVREIMIVLNCIHWCNPVCRKGLKALNTWDEYHCDYKICQCEHIDIGAYAETLDRVLTAAENKKSLIGPGLCEDKSNLRRRLERMKSYRRETKKERKIVRLAAAGFLAAGIMFSAFASEITAYAYDGMIENSVVSEQVEQEAGNTGCLTEYTMVPDDTLQFNYVGDEDVQFLTLQGFHCTLQDEIYSTNSFRLEAGDQLLVSVGVTPDDVMVKVGIQQPNAVWRYVYSDGSIIHTFDITQTGYHKVFVWNETDTEIQAVGYYSFE